MEPTLCTAWRRIGILLCLVLLCVFSGCRASRVPAPARPDAAAQPRAPEQERSSSSARVASNVTGHPLGEGTFVGAPAVFENLTVFPILARKQTDVGPITTLDAALAKGHAEVRELGAEDVAESAAPGPGPEAQVSSAHSRRAHHPQARAQLVRHPLMQGSGPRVGTLVIQNKADIPIYVLAGTVVKGGNQDRQIGQDFIVGPQAMVPVDAFCVEHGRWSGQRAGAATGGKFKTAKQLATSKVRAAGQYRKDQGKVWAEVSKVNAANQKSSRTESLWATLDDAEVAKQREALARRVIDHLARLGPRQAVVGFAYAVDGRIKGVRWFANHRIFGLFEETLVNTSAVDAITARGGKPPQAPPAVKAPTVTRFIAEVDAAKEKEQRATPAENVNEYSESERAYGSKTRLKAKPGKRAVDVSADYVAK